MASIQHPTTRQTLSVPDETVETYLERGWLRPGDATARTLPTADWTIARIRAYAAQHDVDLAGRRLKADMLGAIAEATATSEA